MRKVFEAILIYFFSISIGKASAPPNQTKTVWPEVFPLQQTIRFVDRQVTAAKIDINGKNGKPLYLLECYLNAFDNNKEYFEYTGAFECRLTSLYDSSSHYRTLLTERNPQLRDWWSRGVFKIEEIVPKNVVGVRIQYPGFGRNRCFRLRGMKITLDVANVVLDSSSAHKKSYYRERVKSLDLKVAVTPDSMAASEISESPVNDSTSEEIKWPEVRPFNTRLHFSGHQLEKIRISGRDGTPLYLLHCVSQAYNEEGRQGENDFDYSGDFECRLTSFYDNRQNSLLKESLYTTRDWESRGCFHIIEMLGKCGDYPDYGRVRDFRLRGMDIRLSILNLKTKQVKDQNGHSAEEMKSLDLEVRVESDSTAISEIAAPSKYKDPYFKDPRDSTKWIRDCSKVLLR